MGGREGREEGEGERKGREGGREGGKGGRKGREGERAEGEEGKGGRREGEGGREEKIVRCGSRRAKRCMNSTDLIVPIPVDVFESCKQEMVRKCILQNLSLYISSAHRILYILCAQRDNLVVFKIGRFALFLLGLVFNFGILYF